MLASLIAGQRLDVCEGPGGRELIGRAELALVGQVPAGIRRPEGPFGDHYGYYSLRHDYPVFEVESIAQRRDALYPATVVGKPRQEDFYIGDLLQELLSPLFPLVILNLSRSSKFVTFPPRQIKKVLRLQGFSAVLCPISTPSLTDQNLPSPSQPLRSLPLKMGLKSWASS